jgi:hypothetical protein
MTADVIEFRVEMKCDECGNHSVWTTNNRTHYDDWTAWCSFQRKETFHRRVRRGRHSRVVNR